MPPTKIGDWVKERRQDHGMTQEQVELIVGCPKGAIGRIERGQKRLVKDRYNESTIVTIIRLADTLALDDDDRRYLLSFRNLQDHADVPRLPDTVEYMEHFPLVT